MTDLYARLGVTRDATPDAIKAAYRAKAKELHPDHGGDATDFADVVAAYEVLSNPERRAAYDRGGMITDQRIDADLTHALGVIERMLGQAIGQLGPDGIVYNDVIAVMAGAVDEGSNAMRESIATNEREIAKLKKFATRFSVVDGKTNHIVQMIEFKIVQHEKVIAGARQALIWNDKAAQILADYSFKADAEPVPQVLLAFGGLGFGATGSTRPLFG